jgi:hypothetical protein
MKFPSGRVTALKKPPKPLPTSVIRSPDANMDLDMSKEKIELPVKSKDLDIGE